MKFGDMAHGQNNHSSSLFQAFGQWGRSKKQSLDERDLGKQNWGGRGLVSAQIPLVPLVPRPLLTESLEQATILPTYQRS